MTLGWRYIVLHHSSKPDGETLDWPGIRKYHTSYRIDYHIVSEDDYHVRVAANDGDVFETPWSDIGYHFGVEDVYGELEVLFGRPLTRGGAHCTHRNMNSKGIGICCIGNFDAETPSDTLKHILVHRLILPICYLCQIPWNRIVGHREVAKDGRTCPGNNWDLDELRDTIRHELK